MQEMLAKSFWSKVVTRKLQPWATGVLEYSAQPYLSPAVCCVKQVFFWLASVRVSVCLSVCLSVQTKAEKLLIRNRFNPVAICVSVNRKSELHFGDIWFWLLTFKAVSIFGLETPVWAISTQLAMQGESISLRQEVSGQASMYSTMPLILTAARGFGG